MQLKKVSSSDEISFEQESSRLTSDQEEKEDESHDEESKTPSSRPSSSEEERPSDNSAITSPNTTIGTRPVRTTKNLTIWKIMRFTTLIVF